MNHIGESSSLKSLEKVCKLLIYNEDTTVDTMKSSFDNSLS
jgi:hypothetical protein